ALDEFLAGCESDGVRVRRIPVDYASHTGQVAALRGPLMESLDAVAPRSADVAFYSTVTGGLLDTAQLGAQYWYRNLRATVRFEQATRALLEDGYRAFVEVSPHPVLTLGVQDTIDAAAAGAQAVVLATLRRDDGSWLRFLTALAHAHVHGLPVRWADLLATPP